MNAEDARAPSIVRPIVLLVVAAVAVATFVQFAVTFSGPPPRSAPVAFSRIAETLRTGTDPSPMGRPLKVTIQGAPPPPLPGGEPSPALDARIATLIPGAAGKVIGDYVWRGPALGDAVPDTFRIAMATRGGFRVVETAPEAWFTRWHAVTLTSMFAVLAVLAYAAWRIALAISGPIARLARAAHGVRLESRTPIPREGPREVRELADAIDSMRARILESAEARTAMLVAIAHDLGTPLARLAFRIEQMPEGARERAAADIDEARSMLADVLRLSRDSRTSEQRERIELGSMIESVAEDLRDGGMPIDVSPGPRAVVAGDAQALRRMLVNLAENAVRYGGIARMGWTRSEGRVDLWVDDDGPGFGPHPELLFAPFVRGEGSRSRSTGGTGLGLAIVRGIAEAHGGRVSLESRTGGGGRAMVRLPAE
ncbi:sensor histidine kinase [Sphingomonas canadensis]|uniref:histidine kinase n=1 Tax=Sphingomonas canadensis TaxID=1219257 RepID=A0ABW3H3X8_9SPHN|nr:HAMP domain-containing sensor histidine kinase [Sphingomonas canadensis]MCW3835386.1 HAMP domain-containing histidine kinase [Sphingomonas canadensis]